jgi:hypothetical protein
MTKHSKPGAPPPKAMSGGSGLLYAASTIIFLTKTPDYDKDKKVFKGNILTATLFKSRNTLEHLKLKTRLDNREGMDRFYGLFDVAKQLGIAVNEGNGFKMGGKKFHQKNIDANPAEYFTEDVLKSIDELVQKVFRYGKGTPIELLDIDDDDDTEFDIDKKEEDSSDIEEPTVPTPTPESPDETNFVKKALTKRKIARK